MKQNIASKVKTLLEEVIIQHGFSLWDITFGKEGGEMLLTVTVDSDKEISLETCVAKRISAGGTGIDSVEKQIEYVSTFIG